MAETRGSWRRFTIAVVLVLCGSGVASPSTAEDRPAPIPPKTEDKTGLASGEFREGARDRAARSAAASTDSRARVEVLHELTAAQARRRVQEMGGVVTGEVPDVLVQAEVPWGMLEQLESSEGVTHVRPPQRVNLAPHRYERKVGQQVEKMKAKRWHRAGFKGQGIKIGVIDLFSKGYYKRARSNKEVPAPAGTFCKIVGSTCDVFTVYGPGQQHGTAVTEVIHEQAPKAQIYLASAYTASDLQEVVDYFYSEGVRIISRSLATPYDGPGDGTGPVDTIVDNAAAAGMTWFNSSGNSADGAYYRANGFADVDTNDFHEFAPGSEFLVVPCPIYSIGLRWSDFGEPKPTDFDLYAFEYDGLTYQPYAWSIDDQTAGARPLENFSGDGLGCGPNSVDDMAYIAIYKFAAGGDLTDVIEFQNNGVPMSDSTSGHSAAVPVCDSHNLAQVCVGAVDPARGTLIAGYSSQGPTNDNFLKPDISAPACLRSYTYRPFCFNGTSSAAPAAAGAAALALEANPGFNSAALGNFVRASVVDRGVPGPDDVYGTGEFKLPALP